MNRGWAAYLTLASVELVGGTPAAPLADLNGGDLQALYTRSRTTLTDEQAKFIILYRQYGRSDSGGQQPGGSRPAQPASPTT